MKADLHNHTLYSDGNHTPEELVLLARRMGIRYLGVTDHDRCDGLREAEIYGRKYGVRIVPGVEFSTLYPGKRPRSVHLLGYYMDFRDPRLVRIMEAGKSRFRKKYKRIVRFLNGKGLKVTYPMLMNSTGYVGGGAVVYAMLVQAGKADFTDADWHEYDRHLRDAEASLPREFDPMSTYDALKLIRRFRGIPVLAHPFADRPEERLPVRLVADLVRRGIMGMELLGDTIPPHSPYVRKLKSLARKSGLVLTGGSDTHNKGKRCEMGRNSFDYHDELLKLRTARG
jgi:predicted metal-dependent phosphoesterase TrpH